MRTNPPRLESERTAAARLAAALNLNVSRASVRRLRAKGIDTADTRAVDHALKMQTKKPGKFGPPQTIEPNRTATTSLTSSLSASELDATLAGLERDLLEAPDYETGRSIRIKITGFRDLVRVQKERGHLIDRNKVEAEGYEAGLLFKHALMRIPSELLPMLVGLDYPDAVDICEKWTHQLLTDLYHLTEQHLVAILTEMGATDAARRTNR